MVNFNRVDQLIQLYINKNIDIYNGADLIKKDILTLKRTSFNIDHFKIKLLIGYEQFEEQLTNLIKRNPLPEDIVAYNFGLYQTSGEFHLYITGSRDWSYEDEDWATNNDYFPEENLSGNSLYRKIYRDWRTSNDLGLFLSIVSTVMLVNTYITKNPDMLPNKAVFATGFDDGDLYTFRNPLTNVY
ncbi:hypothetical protein [Priestia megaterium]|uniref:Uncharacterized protein n=1 Tax=Priestia megaterium TaxID=1404 RepID=A0A6M6E3P7_PRIMG|nr:hypothetical protein [Priestia megaterium]QJX80244.1 hypothetical protein FDZ14_29550 [Priestia megaterium]